MNGAHGTQPTPVSHTGYVILGLIGQGRKSGYDIKASVDRSARYFWALSYGQIYPELRRLEARGFIEGEPSPEGQRRRMAFTLTDAGRAALGAWLVSPPQILEVRNEGLLKLFFADAMEPGEVIGLVRAQRRLQEQRLEALEPKLPFAIASCAAGEVRFPLEVLEFGIAQARWAVDWWAALQARLEIDSTSGSVAARDASQTKAPGQQESEA
jgi:PadR family transcriptional regulator, regulatory protein AphA